MENGALLNLVVFNLAVQWNDLKNIFKKHIDLQLLPPHFGEGNGTPLQYSCLENPMDGGAWKAAVYGVAEGWT